MEYDVIIIGAGLGGLTSGAILAKQGRKVLILEQHNIPGGCATTFKRHGIRFEVGLHEMDWDIPSKNIKYTIFKKLGILEKLPLIPLPHTWRLKTESKEYTIPEGRENAKKYFKSLFPEESKGIDRYFNDMKMTISGHEKLPSDLNPIEFFLYPFTKLPFALRNLFQNANTGDKLDKYFKSNELKYLLDINLNYYSNNPYKLSWFFHSVAQYAYYNSSVFIKGGSQTLSDMLADIIIKNGSEIRYLADVQQIQLKGNKATGIIYQDRKTKDIINEYGRKIIANCSPDTIFYGKMLPEKFREPIIEGLKSESSLYTIYIIFKEKLSKKYPDMAYSTFLGPDKIASSPLKEATDTINSMPVEERPFVLVNYDIIDSGLVPEGDPRGFGVISAYSFIDEWETHSSEEYKAKKELLACNAFDYIEKIYPSFKDNIEYFEVSTPKTIQRYTKSPSGTAYGYEQKGYPFLFEAFWPCKTRAPRRATQVKNLYFTGAWAVPGGGFTGAILSGYGTTIDIYFSLKMRIIVGTLFCTISGTAIGTIQYWLPYLLEMINK